MAKKLRCKNCGTTSSLDDAGTNWRPLGRRNGKTLVACDCGHGIYVGIFRNSHAPPADVDDQREQMRRAGIDADTKIRTPGDIQKALREAPPGDTDFAVGDRIVDPVSGTAEVKEVYEEDGVLWLRVLYDKGHGSMTCSIDPVQRKIKKLQQDNASE